MSKQRESVAGFHIRGGKGTWVLSGDLSVSRASELHGNAIEILKDQRAQTVVVKLPEAGLPLAAYQIVMSLSRSLELLGRECQIEGTLAPFGGQTW